MQERKNFRCRMALYALLLLVCFLLQSSGARALFCGRPLPMCFPSFLQRWPCLRAPLWRAIFGFAGGNPSVGQFHCPRSSSVHVLQPGLLGRSFFASRYMRRVFPTLLMCGIFLSLFKTLLSFFFFYALVYEGPFPRAIAHGGEKPLLSPAFFPCGSI